MKLADFDELFDALEITKHIVRRANRVLQAGVQLEHGGRAHLMVPELSAAHPEFLRRALGLLVAMMANDAGILAEQASNGLARCGVGRELQKLDGDLRTECDVHSDDSVTSALHPADWKAHNHALQREPCSVAKGRLDASDCFLASLDTSHSPLNNAGLPESG